eukprot:958350-Prymnesium_polylepis.1
MKVSRSQTTSGSARSARSSDPSGLGGSGVFSAMTLKMQRGGMESSAYERCHARWDWLHDGGSRGLGGLVLQELGRIGEKKRGRRLAICLARVRLELAVRREAAEQGGSARHGVDVIITECTHQEPRVAAHASTQIHVHVIAHTLGLAHEAVPVSGGRWRRGRREAGESGGDHVAAAAIDGVEFTKLREHVGRGALSEPDRGVNRSHRLSKLVGHDSWLVCDRRELLLGIAKLNLHLAAFVAGPATAPRSPSTLSPSP